jgi:DNA methylase/ParB-like nuclease family protein
MSTDITAIEGRRQDKADGRISVTYRPIADLKPDQKNPRIHGRKQIRQIANSIETFGFITPVVVDANLSVIAGHGRLLACQQLDWTEVPTVRLDHLTPAQAKAFQIADNRLTEISTWDDRLLGEQLKELSEVDLDFSLEVTGFEVAEIDLRIEQLGETDAEADPADDVPTPSSGTPVSRPGDLWFLGQHRVYCGSALEASAYATLMNKQTAGMVFTDPPFNVPIAGHASGLGAVRHQDFVMASGEMDEAEFTAFLSTACKHMANHSADGAIHFVCMDWRHIGELSTAGRTAYTELKNICVWAKHSGGMGSLYRSQHELVFVFKSGSGRHRNNVQLGRFGRNRTNVWNYRGINCPGGSGDEGNLLALHPTVKPVALVADAILDCSERGDIVLDAFLGSGSTIIAAERTGRRGYGLELDPRYVDTIVRRWQDYTGESAKLNWTEQTFEAVEAERKVAYVH